MIVEENLLLFAKIYLNFSRLTLHGDETRKLLKDGEYKKFSISIIQATRMFQQFK